MAKTVVDKNAVKSESKVGGALKGVRSTLVPKTSTTPVKTQVKTPAKPSSSRPAPAKTAPAPRGVSLKRAPGRIRTFFREVRVEMSKVTWPPRREILQSTGVVIIAVVIAAAFIGAFDYIWSSLVHLVKLG